MVLEQGIRRDRRKIIPLDLIRSPLQEQLIDHGFTLEIRNLQIELGTYSHLQGVFVDGEDSGLVRW
jgi:hypothetical protein